MASREEYAAQPRAARLERLAHTPDELAAAIAGRDDVVLSRQPDGKNWSAKEIVCHLRDIEELCLLRFRIMLAMESPRLLAAGARPPDPNAWGLVGDEMPIDPDRWAEERQYLRCDTGDALAAFRRRRQESIDFLRRLAPEAWARSCRHVTLGRVTFDDWTALMPVHDDNHLDQLRRAFDGRA